MNFLDLTDTLRVMTGYPDVASTFRDSRLQQYRDALNATLDEVGAAVAPSYFALQQQSTIVTVAGTATYLINDWSQRILSVYGTDINYTYKLDYIRARNADMSGIRNPNIQSVGRYAYTDGMRTSTPALSGTAGSGSGATVAEGGTSVVFGSSNATLTSAVVGRMLRLNGEDGDYKILTQDGSHTVTIDRPVKSRLRGDGTSNVGAGYTAATCRWEIGPSGRLQIQILPVPQEVRTLNVRSMMLPRRMLNDSDTPEIQSEYHHLIWKGAMLKVASSKQNTESYQLYTTEYQTALTNFRKSDIDDVESTDSPPMERLRDKSFLGAAPYGTYSRGDGFGPGGVAAW